jgi:hypothetical protein
MPNIRHELALWIQIVTIIVIWVALIYVSQGTLAIGWEAVKRIPDVVVIYGAAYFAFTRWLWRWSALSGWLIPFPDLQGTWTGHLTSTWVNPATGGTPSPIPMSLVIRQSFTTMSLTMHTLESTSVSTAVSFDGSSQADSVKLISYMYSNQPRVSVRHRSELHDGAALLRVASGPPMSLQGEYWTSRRTSGEMSLTFRDRELDDAFGG